MEPSNNSQVYVNLGPNRSHNRPASTRKKTVTATEPMISQPICSFVSPSSFRMMGIKGASPNHEKKHRKNAIHDRWNARICGVSMRNNSIRSAGRMDSGDSFTVDIVDPSGNRETVIGRRNPEV